MIINLKNESYEIVIKKDSINDIYLDLKPFNKVLIISDDNIPKEYSNIIKKKRNDIFYYEIAHGESSKNITSYLSIQEQLIKNNFSRNDLIIALGGGVIGDLVGFVASTYKRGIKFIQIPTSTLSQIDSSIGGKTAIDYLNIKNIIGTFYQPYKVFIDTNTLKSLDKRNYYNGLIEALKMALLFDKELYNVFLHSNIDENIDFIIERSLYLKKIIVEKDPYEKGERKTLNFGHTIGHAIESFFKYKKLHGECVGLGMLYFIQDKNLKKEVKYILKEKLCQDLNIKINANDIISYIQNDKKTINNSINIINLYNLTEYKIENISFNEIKEIIERGF